MPYLGVQEGPLKPKNLLNALDVMMELSDLVLNFGFGVRGQSVRCSVLWDGEIKTAVDLKYQKKYFYEGSRLCDSRSQLA